MTIQAGVDYFMILSDAFEAKINESITEAKKLAEAAVKEMAGMQRGAFATVPRFVDASSCTIVGRGHPGSTMAVCNSTK